MVAEQTIINVIKNNPQISFYLLVRKLNIRPHQNKALGQILNQLKQKGSIAFSRRTNGFYIPRLITTIETELKIRETYGFVFFDGEDDAEPNKRAIVFSENFNSALPDDLVNVSIYAELDQPEQYFGIVNNIVKRQREFIYGQINVQGEFEPLDFPTKKYLFKYDLDKIPTLTYVQFKIRAVDKMVIFLELVRQIQEIDQPYADIDLLIASMNIDCQFNPAVMAEAQLIPDAVLTSDRQKRHDLTKALIVTIDGQKTKDFDDAISVKKTDHQSYVLGVHIADVATYVQENSAIDEQAYARGTSIYLLNKVIPMLPEKLSNGICSLNPNVDRLTLTLEAEIDQKGHVLKARIYPSIINSKYRLTYDQVANYENDPIIQNDLQLVQMLQQAYELSTILSVVKKNQGYVDFEIEEPIIELNEKGQAIAITSKSRLSSEVLIENFMVLANEQVSLILTKQKLPCLYRVHEAPSDEKFGALADVLKVLQLDHIKVHYSADPRQFAKTVEEIKNERFDDFIKITLLKTMQKAKYSPHNIGHFGLAAQNYSHFTSPIRRYPDLVLHRIIWELLIKKNLNYLSKIEQKIEQIGIHTSSKEEEAFLVERRIIDVKKAEFYEKKINQILPATIVSVQKFGLFVEFEDKVDALIHVSNLSSEQECNADLQGTKMVCGVDVYQLGQSIKAQILSINKLAGKVDAKIIK